jgi:hypothetical protein
VVLYGACSLYVLIDYVLYIMQYAKQPPETLLCGYYTVYLRESEKFSINYRKLVNNEKNWQRRKFNANSITRTIADICGLVMHHCMNEKAKRETSLTVTTTTHGMTSTRRLETGRSSYS